MVTILMLGQCSFIEPKSSPARLTVPLRQRLAFYLYIYLYIKWDRGLPWVKIMEFGENDAAKVIT